jgi:hypothetical protein
VQELAAAGGVGVQSLQPVAAGNGDQFNLALEANYGNFLHFLASFETLQVAIAGFEVRPSMTRRDTLSVSVNFRHTTSPGVSPDYAKAFAAELRTELVRNPFDAAVRPVAVPRATAGNDLSSRLHLTSISSIGKSRFATIDGRDYGVGDRLQGRVVSEIGTDSVTLTATEGGEDRRYVVRFRADRRRGT